MRLHPPTLLLAALMAGPALGGSVTVDVPTQTVETSRLFVTFENYSNPQLLWTLRFKDWNTVRSLATIDSYGHEFWGQSLRGIDSTGFIQWETIEARSWDVTVQTDQFVQVVVTCESGSQPTVTTTYDFFADQPWFTIERTIDFTQHPWSGRYQGYLPRIAFVNTYRALRWRDTTQTLVQRGFCFGGCETTGWDGRWLQFVGYDGTHGLSIAQVYPPSTAAGTPIVRGYGPNSFAGWVAPLHADTLHDGPETERMLIAFSTDPADIGQLDSLWSAYGDHSLVGVAPGSARGAPRLEVTPNPSVHGARVAWTQSRAGRATLDVFEVGGRRVARLFDGVATAGAQSVDWSGRDERGGDVRPGLYFARLASGDGVRVARLVRIR